MAARREGKAGQVDVDHLIGYFLELVAIDSTTFHEQQVAERLERDLIALGLTVTNDRSGPDGIGNIVATLPGGGGMPIALSAHIDTVEPGRGIKPSIVDGVIRSDGTTILAADCKASLAIILEALGIVRARRLRHGHVELLLTWGEERGHAGAKLLRLDGLKSRLALVLDGPGGPGAVIGGAPSYDSFKAVFHGKAAHAGFEPEKGCSAILAAAEAIHRMRLGRIDADTTANVGVIHGGIARNAVPDRVEIEGEARSLDVASLERHTESLRTAIESAARDVGARVDLKVVREYSGYRFDEHDPGVAFALETARHLGLPATLDFAPAGSDANTFNERGLPSVALGVGIEAAHTVEEHIAVADMVAATEYVVELITRAADAR
jgi:tripeptide aminopeptidase